MTPGRSRNFLAVTLIALAAATAAVVGVRTLPFLAVMGRWVGDFQIAMLTPAEPQHPDIVIAAVTEDTLKAFPYRSPVDRRFVGELLRALEAKGARGVLVDLLFDQPTEAEKDDFLKARLRDIRIPLVIAYAGAEEGLQPSQLRYLDAFVPPELRGFANLVKDPFEGTARWIYPGREIAGGSFVRGMPSALAVKLGRESPSKEVAIAWRGRPAGSDPAFRMIPAHAVKVIPPAWIKDKVVLVGSDLTLTDRHRTPFAVGVGERAERETAGVIVHAHALAQILEGRKPVHPGLAVEVGIVFLATLLIGGLAMIESGLALRLVMVVAVTGGLWVGGFALFHYAGFSFPLITTTLSLALAFWLVETWFGREQRKQKRFIKEAFSHYVSPHLVEQLMASPDALTLGGERRELSFLFTDVADFTTLSEGLDSSVVADLLNRYFDGVCRIVMRHDGTVVDFIGDAVFAAFGAPIPSATHARQAVACAREIAEFSEGFSAGEKAAGIPFGHTRIGVHTGKVVIGNLGSEIRFKYSAVGDAVNTASRIEGLNKYFGTRICISERTVTKAGGGPFRPLGRFILKGRTEPLQIFEAIPDTAAKSDYMRLYAEAYALLDRGDPACAPLFECLCEENPADRVAAHHRARIGGGALDAVIRMESK